MLCHTCAPSSSPLNLFLSPSLSLSLSVSLCLSLSPCLSPGGSLSRAVSAIFESRPLFYFVILSFSLFLVGVNRGCHVPITGT